MACWLGIGVNINSQIRISILAFKEFSSFKHKMVVCVGGGEPRESPSRPKMMMVISICLPPYSGSVFLETLHSLLGIIAEREGSFRLDSLFPDGLTVCFLQTQAMAISL